MASNSIKSEVSKIDSVLVPFWLPLLEPKSPLYYFLVCVCVCVCVFFVFFEVEKKRPKVNQVTPSNLSELGPGGGGSLRNLLLSDRILEPRS